DRDDSFSGGDSEACEQGGLLPEITGESDCLDPRILSGHFRNPLERAVATAIVDDDHFQTHPAGSQRIHDDVDRMRDAARFVVRGYYDAQQLGWIRVHGLNPRLAPFPVGPRADRL